MPNPLDARHLAPPWDVAFPVDPEAMRLRTRAGELRCPLCRDRLGRRQAQACPSCETPYHAACLRELGGCGTLGCAKSNDSAVDRAEQTSDQVEGSLSRNLLRGPIPKLVSGFGWAGRSLQFGMFLAVLGLLLACLGCLDMASHLIVIGWYWLIPSAFACLVVFMSQVSDPSPRPD